MEQATVQVLSSLVAEEEFGLLGPLTLFLKCVSG